MKIPVHDRSGVVVDHIEVQEGIFDVQLNKALVHQAVVCQLANARQGTAATKTRAQVAGSTRKLFRQKHTGPARAGSRRSPVRKGGGVAFGPHPRDFSQAMPKKMRRLALRCVLSAKARDDELVVVDELEFLEPRTREMIDVLAALGSDSSALVVTGEPASNVIKSARNIPGIWTLPAALLNVVDLMSRRKLIMTVAAVRKAEAIWGSKSAEVDAP